VTNAVDVAVRRHIRTQIAQDGARMTLERLNDMDVALVEVSSHEGARPTHAVWQGRCYSLHGTVKIDGVTYNDFYTSTNYGAVDGLLGANCRHSFGPYKHGAKRFYSPDPKHPSGLSNDEVYNLTQKQRYYERQIRAAKRELRGAQQIYDKQGGIEALTELSKAKDKLAKRQNAMRTFIEESNAKCKKGTSVLTRHPNREWAGDMPKITTAAKTRGLLKDFQSKLKTELKTPKRASTETLAGVAKGRPMSFEEADGNKSNPKFSTLKMPYITNCQTCVVAYEARLRGYNVEAKGFDPESIMDKVAIDPSLAWIDSATGQHPTPIVNLDALSPQKFMKHVAQVVKPNERYTLRYATESNGDGHIVSLARNSSGEVCIYDPQSGELLEGRSYRNKLRSITYKAVYQGVKLEYAPEILRVDNLDFDTSVVNQILKAADDS
jgi:hypothetical protein